MASTPAFGFFLYYTLEKVVCPYLAYLFGMRIFHINNGRRGEGQSFWALQWTGEYLAGVERATRNETNLPFGWQLLCGASHAILAEEMLSIQREAPVS